MTNTTTERSLPANNQMEKIMNTFNFTPALFNNVDFDALKPIEKYDGCIMVGDETNTEIICYNYGKTAVDVPLSESLDEYAHQAAFDILNNYTAELSIEDGVGPVLFFEQGQDIIFIPLSHDGERFTLRTMESVRFLPADQEMCEYEARLSPTHVLVRESHFHPSCSFAEYVADEYGLDGAGLKYVTVTAMHVIVREFQAFQAQETQAQAA
jgi:hypothetical protein